VRDVAMQIAACPNVEYVRTGDIPQDMMPKKSPLKWAATTWPASLPNIREKIVEGRIEKRLKELSLMDQPFIKDQNISVEELVKQTVG
jgi:elongation factor Ts